MALGVLTLGVLLIGVDGTVLAVSTPFITTDLRASATDVLWIGDIYSFILAGLLITMGSIGDRVGHKKLLLCAAAGFALVSTAAAYAQSAGQLIGARALLGVAGAALAPSTLALIRGLFPHGRERSVAVGIWASAFSAGSALGPVIGGLLLEHFWWGSVFLVNLPVIAVLIVGGTVLLPELPSRSRDPWDLLGAGLFLVGTLGLVYSVKEVAAHGLSTGIAITGAIGAGALALFFRRQLRLSAPLIDLRLFSNRVFSVVVGANLLAMVGLSGIVYFLSQFFQLVDGYTPMKAGLAELPAALGAAAFGVLAGIAVRFWSARVVLASGLGIVGAALASLTLIRTSTAYPQLGIALFMVGVGLGVVYTVANDVILASVAPEQAGAAAAVSETSFELGMALGVAALGSVVAGVYRGMEIPSGTSDAVAELARETLSGAHQAAATLPSRDGQELLIAAQSAFTGGLAVAAGVGSVLLLASAVSVWVLLRPPSTRPIPLNRNTSLRSEI
jgi:DHA2 family multidrug resistance protein-like MFS transporter